VDQLMMTLRQVHFALDAGRRFTEAAGESKKSEFVDVVHSLDCHVRIRLGGGLAPLPMHVLVHGNGPCWQRER